MEFTGIVEDRPSVWKFDCQQRPKLSVIPKRKRRYLGARHCTLEILAEYITEAGREPVKNPCRLVGAR